MIPNVTRGGRTRGLMRYLTTPKEQAREEQTTGLEPRELHTNPHLVAGSDTVMEEWAGYDLSPRYNPSAADELAVWLDAAAAAHRRAGDGRQARSAGQHAGR